MQIPNFFTNPLQDRAQALQIQNALLQQQQLQRQYEDTLESRAGYEAAAKAAQEQYAPEWQTPAMFRQPASESKEAKEYEAAQAANALVPATGTSLGGFELKGTADERSAEMNRLKSAYEARQTQDQQSQQGYPSTMSQRGFQPPPDASYSYLQGAQEYQKQVQNQQTDFYNNRVLPLYNAWISTKDDSIKQQLMSQVDKLRGRPEAQLAVHFLDAIKGVKLTPGGTIAAGSMMTDGLKNMLLAGTTNPVMKEYINGLPVGRPIPAELTVDMQSGNVISSEAGKGAKGSATPKATSFKNTTAGLEQAAKSLNLTADEKAQAREFLKDKTVGSLEFTRNSDGSVSIKPGERLQKWAVGGGGGGGGGTGDGGAGSSNWATGKTDKGASRQIKQGFLDKVTPKNYQANMDRVYKELMRYYNGDEAKATEAMQTLERNGNMGQAERRMASAAIAAKHSLQNVFIPTMEKWVKSRNFASDRRALASLASSQGSIVDKGMNWLQNWATEQRLSPEGRAYAVAAFDAIRQVNQAITTRGGAQKSLDWEHSFFSPSSSADQLRAVARIELDSVKQAEAAYGRRTIPERTAPEEKQTYKIGGTWKAPGTNTMKVIGIGKAPDGSQQALLLEDPNTGKRWVKNLTTGGFSAQ